MGVKMEVIAIDPDPLAPYAIAPGWRVGDVLFLSGQAAIDESGTIIGAGDIDAQISQTFVNIDKVLAAGGSSRDRIVKVTLYLTDMAHFPQIVHARKKYFSSPYPVATLVEGSALASPERLGVIDVLPAS